jgi:hypothetical protein
MQEAARVIKDSISPNGKRILSAEVDFPRSALAELRTHRLIVQGDPVEDDIASAYVQVFSGTEYEGQLASMNSASTRAIPIEKMIKRVQDNPYIPLFTGAMKGMQGKEIDDAEWQGECEELLLEHLQQTVGFVRKLAEKGVAKQDAGRYLEPMAPHTVLLTATEFDNFFALRDDKHAYPPLQRMAKALLQAIDASEPEPVGYGYWHLPYIRQSDLDEIGKLFGNDRLLVNGYALKVSVGRCARLSYLTQDGLHSLDEDASLHNRLLYNTPVHASPAEHQATPLVFPKEQVKNFFGWRQYRSDIPNETVWSGRVKAKALALGDVEV